MDEFVELENALQGLIGSISPQQRRNLARLIVTRLRSNNQKRIADQVAPDGTPYPARLRQQKGRIKRQMFAKLRTAKWMRASSTASTAVIEFVGQASRIAAVHHHGLRDRVRPGGPEHQYAERPLLGISDTDMAMLEIIVMDHHAL